MAFRDVRGHQAQVSFIRSALSGRRPGHAFLFLGPDGVGKMFFAVQVAKFLLCRNADDDACDGCQACRAVDLDIHPDLARLEIAPGKQAIPIEQIREVCRQFSLHPHGERRVAIVRDVDRVAPAASDTLLKTLEEPPAWGKLFLTSSRPCAVPETIHSRCQRLSFGPLSREDVSAILAREPRWEPEAVRVAADLSGGSVGWAQEFLEAGGVELRDDVLRRLLELRSQGNFDLTAWALEKAAENAANLEEQRDGVRLILHLMLRYFRDVWSIQRGSAGGVLFYREQAATVRAGARRFAPAAVEQALELLLDAWRQVNGNAELTLLLESVFFRLGRLVPGPQPDTGASASPAGRIPRSPRELEAGLAAEES